MRFGSVFEPFSSTGTGGQRVTGVNGLVGRTGHGKGGSIAKGSTYRVTRGKLSHLRISVRPRRDVSRHRSIDPTFFGYFNGYTGVHSIQEGLSMCQRTKDFFSFFYRLLNGFQGNSRDRTTFFSIQTEGIRFRDVGMTTLERTKYSFSMVFLEETTSTSSG